MCGLFVICSQDEPIKKEKAIESLKLLEHRGPDYQSFNIFNEDKLFIGHRLLRIRSNLEESIQPITSKGGRYTISYNGEIYNSCNLSRKYLDNAYLNSSDSKVLVELIEKYGIDDTLKKIDGMFAFCLFDREKNILISARDHIGIKPLYKYISDKTNSICYSSEIKPIINYFKNEISFNKKMISEFFKYKYLSNNNTMFKGIKLVEFGNYEKIFLDDFDNYSKIKWFNFNESHIEQSFDIAISNTCKEQIISKVPVALQLSGGVDSTLIFELLKGFKNIETYSVIFQNNYEFNEENYIRKVLNNNKFRNKYKFVSFQNNYFNEKLADTTLSLESPLNHPHTLAIKDLAEVASGGEISVLLSGEGADELFGGYKWHEFYKNSENVISAVSFLKDEELSIFEGSDFFELGICDLEREKVWNNCSGENKILEYESRTHLQELLIRQDKMMMAHSIESRVPYLSRNLIPYSIKLRDELRYTSNKFLIKNMLLEKGYKVDFVNREKIGFRLPYNEWLKSAINELLKEFKGKHIVTKVFGKKIISKLEAIMQKPSKFTLLCKYIWIMQSLISFLEVYEFGDDF